MSWGYGVIVSKNLDLEVLRVDGNGRTGIIRTRCTNRNHIAFVVGQKPKKLEARIRNAISACSYRIFADIPNVVPPHNCLATEDLRCPSSLWTRVNLQQALDNTSSPETHSPRMIRIQVQSDDI